MGFAEFEEEETLEVLSFVEADLTVERDLYFVLLVTTFTAIFAYFRVIFGGISFLFSINLNIFFINLI